MLKRSRLLAALFLLIGLGLVWYVTHTELHYGLDLSGGTHLVYQADTSKLTTPGDVNEAMEALRQVIEQRINAFGVGEPVVQVEHAGLSNGSEERLIVELPGVTDTEQAVAAIGKTPLLEFKLINPDYVAPVAISVSSSTASTTVTASSTSGQYIDTGLTGRMLKGSQLMFGSGQGTLSNAPVVLLNFNDEGSALFAEITKAHVGDVLAIFLDGKAISTPTVQQEITGGTAQITGDFTPEEARDLVRNLNLGALPVPITLVSTQTIGPSLGAVARQAGITAGLVGMILVSIFLILWYRLPGVTGVVALGFYLVLVLALFMFLHIVLTAAGVAGFILSLGMAVDANILAFERIKEELREHKDNVLEAVRQGFARAWPSIRDGHFTTLISAVVLYMIGTSLTKGFAVTLALGVLVSMFSGVVVSRAFLMAIGTKRFTGAARFLYSSGLHIPPREDSQEESVATVNNKK
jgi:protein-export membrane protein SecD